MCLSDVSGWRRLRAFTSLLLTAAHAGEQSTGGNGEEEDGDDDDEDGDGDGEDDAAGAVPAAVPVDAAHRGVVVTVAAPAEAHLLRGGHVLQGVPLALRVGVAAAAVGLAVAGRPGHHLLGEAVVALAGQHRSVATCANG